MSEHQTWAICEGPKGGEKIYVTARTMRKLEGMGALAGPPEHCYLLNDRELSEKQITPWELLKSVLDQ